MVHRNLKRGCFAVLIPRCTEVAERRHKDQHNTIYTFNAVTRPSIFSVLYVLKSFINKSNLKYLVSTKALRCQTQNREKYSIKAITMGLNGERPSPSPLIPNVLFIDLNKLKFIEVSNSVISTYLLFDFFSFEDEIETEPAA